MNGDKYNKTEQKCCCNSENHNHKIKNNDNKCCNLHNEEHGEKCGCSNHEHGHEHSHEHCHDEGCGCGCEHGEGLTAKHIVAYVAGVLLLILAFFGEFQYLNKYVAIACAALVYAFFGKDVWVGAFRGFKSKKIFTEFTLMCAATVGAIFLGEFADAAAVIYLYSLGESVSGEAYSRSRRNISELIEITEETVTVVKDGKVKNIPASEAQTGDVISVRVGDKISLDGEVVGGNGFADTAAVTGESAPKELSVGSKCLSGSSLISGAIYIKVEERYENSTASKLKAAVERASKQKAVREKKITRFAEVFTPVAFCVAVAVFVIGIFIKDNLGEALRSALVVLVASCPCSLVLSVPLAYFSGVGRAARRGIAFRGGQTIDNVAKLDVMVFDKTGTLTSSRPDFVGVIMSKDAVMSKTQLLDISRSALLKSPHASARAFCEKYNSTTVYKVENVENIGGRGLVCSVGGRKAAFGNRMLMTELGVKVESLEKSAIYVAIDGKLCGALLFEAKLKENAHSHVAALRGNGVKRIAIMSGDNIEAVRFAAREAGISEFYAELKPDEKFDKLNNIYKEAKKSDPRGTVAFCGDGLNDSAAIARADVGIAMGSGSALTVESADAVIVDDSLERLGDMMHIAKGTVKIVEQNIALSLGIKIAVVLIGLMGYPSLELAVIADVGTAVVTVLNAMRAGEIKR